MSREITDPEIARLEAALAGLAPAAAPLDRDVLLFNAGRRAAMRGRFWPCTAALLGVLATGLGVALALRPGVPFSERVVFVPVPVPAPPTPVAVVPPSRPTPPTAQAADAASEREHFQAIALRRQVLRWGVDGLPIASTAGAAPRTAPGRPVDPAASSYYQLRMALRTGGEL